MRGKKTEQPISRMQKVNEAIERLKKCQEMSDTESAHYLADIIIAEFAPKRVCMEYEKVKKWYA